MIKITDVLAGVAVFFILLFMPENLRQGNDFMFAVGVMCTVVWVVFFTTTLHMRVANMAIDIIREEAKEEETT